MRKELLIRHIRGEAGPEEEQQVLQWIGRSDRNRQYYIDLKNLWISQTLPETRASAAELASIRSLTTERVEILPRRNILPWITSIIAAAAVLALILVLTVPRRSDKVLYDFAGIPSAYKHTVYTESGVKSRIILPDGTKVWLNSESTLTYPDSFQGDRREISFSGEAYFEVASDSLHPMRIMTGKDFDVEVRGTTFNLKCYEDEAVAMATLYSGHIRLVAKDGQHVDVKPDQTCVIQKRSRYSDIPSVTILSEQKSFAQQQSVWKDGRLLFDATPMEEVVKMLRRWHGVRIVVEDPTILSYRITAEFGAESIAQIASMLRYTARIDYRIDEADGTVYFFSR